MGHLRETCESDRRRLVRLGVPAVDLPEVEEANLVTGEVLARFLRED